jgi:hypothetical protein
VSLLVGAASGGGAGGGGLGASQGRGGSLLGASIGASRAGRSGAMGLGQGPDAFVATCAESLMRFVWCNREVIKTILDAPLVPPPARTAGMCVCMFTHTHTHTHIMYIHVYVFVLGPGGSVEKKSVVLPNIFCFLSILTTLLTIFYLFCSSRAEPLATPARNVTSDSTDAFRIVPFKNGAVVRDGTLELGQGQGQGRKSGEDSERRMVLEKYLRKEQALLLKLMDVIAHSGALDVRVSAQVLRSTR